METTAYAVPQGRPGNGYSGAVGAVPTDESASRIRDAFGMTEELLGHLHSAIDRVEKRLDTVLTPAPPQGSDGGVNKAPLPNGASHLLGRVASNAVQIQNAIDRLHRLAQRVEV